MSINKIKLKQIDADFSGLVGGYGSGYFATTGSFNLLSGSVVPYSYIATGGFLYNTGNQLISGVKNFISRPTLNGNELAALSEVISSSGNNILSGNNTFLGISIFENNNINSNYTNVNFTQTDFTLDSYSSESLLDELGSAVVNTINNQNISGVKNFYALPTVNGTGVLINKVNPIYLESSLKKLINYF